MFRQHTVDCCHCVRTGGSRIEDLDPKICENCFFCDCVRDGFCELQALSREFGISELPFEIHEYDFPVDESTGVIIRDPNKCVKCRRCADVCKNTQAVGVLGMVKLEKGQIVGVTSAPSLAESDCIRCGRCVDVCPTGAYICASTRTTSSTSAIPTTPEPPSCWTAASCRSWSVSTARRPEV
jgi:predicted molibdopterin-dependent oxidoreductase YjgC